MAVKTVLTLVWTTIGSTKCQFLDIQVVSSSFPHNHPWLVPWIPENGVTETRGTCIFKVVWPSLQIVLPKGCPVICFLYSALCGYYHFFKSFFSIPGKKKYYHIVDICSPWLFTLFIEHLYFFLSCLVISLVPMECSSFFFLLICHSFLFRNDINLPIGIQV